MAHEHVEALYPPQTREREVGRLLTYIKEGASCQLVSVPGVGKEDLCELLVYNRPLRTKHLGTSEEKYHFVLVSFTTLRKHELLDVTKLLFLTLTESLRERKRMEEYEVVNALLSEGLTHLDEEWLFSKLKQAVSFLCHDRGLKLVFLLDRFKLFFPEVTGQFFVKLAELQSAAKYAVSFVFTLNRPLEDSLDPALYPTISNLVLGRVLYLSVYDQPSFDFQLVYLEKLVGKSLGKDIKDEIHRITGGHARMAKLCAEEVLASESSSWLVQDLILESSLEATPQNDGERLWKFFLQSKTIRSASYDIWNVLTPQEQSVLKRVVRDKRDKGEEEVVKYLQDIGVLEGRHFTIPLFEAFVRYRAEHKLDETIKLDPETNEIRKGDTILSAKLTGLEYRLLKYLIDHPDTILTKDEIIEAVWSDAKSTAGVTEQAIDQLIFRLRRKVEEDPNQPMHIKTVKGRGVQFIQ